MTERKTDSAGVLREKLKVWSHRWKSYGCRETGAIPAHTDHTLHRSLGLHSPNLQTQSPTSTTMNLIRVSSCKVHRALPTAAKEESSLWYQTEGWYYMKNKQKGFEVEKCEESRG